MPGSWWPRWYEWLEQKASDKVPAPQAQGNDAHPVLEPAPGQYVKVKA